MLVVLESRTFNSFNWVVRLARCLLEYSRFRAARVESEDELAIVIYKD